MMILIIVASMRAVFSSHETSFDLLVDLGDHFSQLHNQFILVLALVALPLTIIDELVLEKVVMALLTRTNVSLRVREQVVWAEGQEVEFTNLRHKKTIST